jgi:tRNA threonylcarbamoyladenosine biosynthesis protein TsaE
MRSKYLTKSPSQTKNLGRILAREILKTKNLKQAFVLGLEGDLGGGKTCFLQGFAKGLGIKTKITSPTFVIMRRYKIQNTRYKIQDFYHIDCYRIKKPKEILTLGFKEIISNPRNIVAVEWADRIKKILPQNSLLFRFKFVNKTSREIVIEFKE